MDAPIKDDSIKKKPYEKLEVRQVPLKPEEAVLGFCKAVAGGAGSGGSCNIYLCLNQGS